jgi:uncharacterized protein (TIGR02996 family)
MSPLDQALQRADAALREGDPKAARGALLDAWREGRSPRLADLIGQLDQRQPDELPSQLKAVLLPRVQATFTRFAALREVDDPRVSAFAIAQLRRPPFTTPGVRELLEAFVATVVARRDVRLLAHAGEIREALRTRLTNAPTRDAVLDRLADALLHLARVSPSPPSPAEQALVERLAPLADDQRSAEALLSAVYADPTADGPRLVYADWLLERGDPRGEFITLQFARATTGAPPSAREVGLLKKHGRAWMGALAPVLSFGKGYARTTFSRGFLSTADIILSVGKKLEPLWQAREWRTVEALEGTWPLELLGRAPLPALRQVDRVITAYLLEELDRARLSLPGTLTRARVDPTLPPGVLKERMPALREVSVWWPRCPTLADLAAFSGMGLRRLEALRVWSAPGATTDEEDLNRLLTELEHTPLDLAELSLVPARRGTRADVIELRRTPMGYARCA